MFNIVCSLSCVGSVGVNPPTTRSGCFVIPDSSGWIGTRRTRLVQSATIPDCSPALVSFASTHRAVHALGYSVGNVPVRSDVPIIGDSADAVKGLSQRIEYRI